MTVSFTRETFASRVGQRFVLVLDEVERDLSLVECSPPGATQGGRPFSLVFVGPAEPILPQRIYRLSHAELGTFELFIVPVGRDERGTSYEAVFT